MAKPLKQAYCDQGYRGHGLTGETTIKIVGKLPKRATRAQRKWLKRRTAIEPIIGHLKSDHRLTRSYLKGVTGNQANVVLAAAGYNLAKLLAWFYCACVTRVLKEKPPAGGSHNNTEPPVQAIILMMRCWIDNRKVSPLILHSFR